MVHYLGLIKTSCAHAHTLLEDVLYVGDLDENGLQKRPTDLHAYLATQLNLHRLAAQEKGIALALDLASEPQHARLHPALPGLACTTAQSSNLYDKTFQCAAGRR